MESLFFFFACETFQNLPFKQLNHTFATRRGGIKKLSSSLSIFFFYLSLSQKNLPLSGNISHFSRAHATSTVHSSHCSSPDASSFGSLYKDPTLSLQGLKANDTSEQNTMGTVAQNQACFPQDENFFLLLSADPYMYELLIKRTTVQHPVASYHPFFCIKFN